MEVITLGDNQEEIVEAVSRVISDGGLVVVPTDTVYGIVGDATNTKAILRFYELKKRAKEKPFLIFVRDIAMARRFTYVSDTKARFLETVWPGPVTVRFHHKEKLPDLLTAGLDTLGMRVPDHSFLLRLLLHHDIPLVQSSANMFRQPTLTNIHEIITSFDEQKIKPDLIIDGGELSGNASVIIDLTANEPRILRSGIMKKDELDSLLVRLTGV
ncbi:MAG: L-threonylcarbamoyladenylate synthase [Candidatus Sungbacteria bacterium]|nr:L-threonylcarbamoyladenylate synthase [bacterium]MDZ4260363.1 L-threonylcarbamoyladenylate synthase [Candidatus Sungbacteria bacterium]